MPGGKRDGGRAVPVLLADDDDPARYAVHEEVEVCANMGELAFQEWAGMRSAAGRLMLTSKGPNVQDGSAEVGVERRDSFGGTRRIGAEDMSHRSAA
jgi:hypothetical protein